jgi:VanZ family protein
MPKDWRDLLSHWLPAVAVMALIFYLSSQPTLPAVPDRNLDVILKKLGHVTVYSLLSIAYLRAVHRFRWPYLLAWVLTALYAASDEYHQSLVPGRTPSVMDFLIDVTSAFVALSFVRWAAESRFAWLRRLAWMVAHIKRDGGLPSP